MKLRLTHKISLLYVGVCFGILIFIGSLLSSNLKKAKFETINTSLQSQLTHIDFALTNFIKDVEKDLKGIVSNPLVRSRDDRNFTNFTNAEESTFQYNIGEPEQSIIDIFNGYRKTHPYVNSVYMGRSNGGFVRSHKRSRPTQYDPRVRPWYTLGWNNPGKVMRTKPYTSVTTSDVNIGIVTALLDEDGKRFGVVGIDVTLDLLTKYIENVKVRHNSHMILIDESGEILASSDKGMRFMNLYSITRDELGPLFDNNKGILDISFSFRTEDPEKKYLFFYTSPYLKWKLVFIIPFSAIYSEVNPFVNSVISDLAVALLLLSLLTLIGLQYFVIRPIKKLDNVTELITRTGNLDHKIEIQRNDEIGHLAQSFNVMTNTIHDTELSLKKSEKELKKHRDHLEEMVKERTVELEKEIAERKQAEERLTNSEQRLFQIINFLPDPTWVVDTEGKVIIWNKAIEKLTGRKAPDIIGKGNYEYAIPFYGERRPVLIDLVRKWDPAYEKKYSSIKKEGESLFVPETYHSHLGSGGTYLSAAASLLFNASDQIVGAIETLRDITDWKDAEKKLRNSEERLDLALKGGDLGFWDVNLLTGETIVNDRWAEMLGYSLDELEQSRNFWMDSIHPDDRERVLKVGQDYREGRIPDYKVQYRAVTKKGDIIWQVSKGAIVRRDEGGSALRMVGTVSDITERKRIEESHKESEENYRLLVKNLPSIVYKGFANWAVEFYDNKIEQLTGYDMHEFNSGKIKWDELVVSEDIESAKHLFIEALKRDKSCIREYRIKNRYGNILWVQERGQIICDDNGKIEYIYGVFFDITKRKRAEEEILASEKKIRAMSESSLDALVMIDGKANIIFWNPSAEKIFGYSAEEIMGKNIHNLIALSEDRELALEGLKKFSQTGEGNVIGVVIERNALRKDDSVFPAEIAISALQMENEWYAVGTVRDISERKKSEERLQQHLKDLKRFQSLSVGREERMIDLKEEINDLLHKMGQRAKYKIV